MQALLRRYRVVPCGTAGALVLGIFWFSASGGVDAGLFSLEALVFWRGLVGHFLWFAGDLWVLVLPLMFWSCYWGACQGACQGACDAGLRLLWPCLELMLGGFGKIQMTQITQFAIYLHKVGNADAKCHEIQFSNKCCFLC